MTPKAQIDHGLTVVNGNWGATSLSGIDGVLRSVYVVLTEAFGKMPDELIQVSTWALDNPRTIYDTRPYKIYLSVHDTYWSQYVYQFAHELCHVLTRFDRFKGHKHKWFEETLCELASLFALHRLAERWVEAPRTQSTRHRSSLRITRRMRRIAKGTTPCHRTAPFRRGSEVTSRLWKLIAMIETASTSWR